MGSNSGGKWAVNGFESTKDDDGAIIKAFTGGVDFFVPIVLFVCEGDERFEEEEDDDDDDDDDDNDLSTLDVDEGMDEDLVTSDVIMGGAGLGNNDVL